MATDTSGDPPVLRDGVSLAALRSFADAHRGKPYTVLVGEENAKAWETLPFERLTTAQVCEVIIKKATAVDGAGCAYPEVLRAARDARSGVPNVARATRFVSHAWNYVFTDLLAALEAHVSADDCEHYWIGARRWSTHERCNRA